VPRLSTPNFTHDVDSFLVSVSVFAGALKFGFYELFKPIFAQLTPSQFLNFLLASIVAGAVASVVLCPCEDARIRMVRRSRQSESWSCFMFHYVLCLGGGGGGGVERGWCDAQILMA
jgi:hypothetical protein